MSQYEVITYEVTDHVAEVFLNRPEKSNAMNPPFWPEVRDVFTRIQDDLEVRAAIVAGNGKNFSAGLDLVEAASGMPSTEGSNELASIYNHIIEMQESFNAIEECRKPVIAAVHGACVGGGLDMIAACDIRICSTDAFFSLREAKIAIIADLGSLNRLPRIVGSGHARELAFTAKDIDAKRALRIGLVNDVYADREACLDAAREMAREIAAVAPLAVQGAKQVMNYSADKSVRDGLKHAAALSCHILRGNDILEAFTAFIEKRPPNFKGN